MRYAAADVGSNSCRLLVAEVKDGTVQTLRKKIITTRIGEGMGRTRWLKPEAISRTVDALDDFLEEMRHWQVTERMVAATSAVREAINRDDFLYIVQEKTGFNIDVLSGEKEAGYSYLGVRTGLRTRAYPLVVDVGGGSTELACWQRKLVTASIPVGAVRAREAGWEEAEIRLRLEESALFPDGLSGEPMVLTGGTATSLAAISREMEEYDPKKVHGTELTLEQVRELCTCLRGMSVEERKNLAGLQPERADIIVQGAVIVKAIMEMAGRRQAVVSESDMLEGMIWTLHERRTGPPGQ